MQVLATGSDWEELTVLETASAGEALASEDALAVTAAEGGGHGAGGDDSLGSSLRGGLDGSRGGLGLVHHLGALGGGGGAVLLAEQGADRAELVWKKEREREMYQVPVQVGRQRSRTSSNDFVIVRLQVEAKLDPCPIYAWHGSRQDFEGKTKSMGSASLRWGRRRT